MRAEEAPLHEVAAWFFGAVERFPDVYQLPDLAWLWQQAVEKSEGHADLVELLRAALLKRLHTAVSACESCELHQHRKAAGGVLDDGDFGNDQFPEAGHLVPIGPLGARVMVVGIGPGQFEQITGQPLVSHQVLAGSFCAQYCDHYEGCFPAGESIPAQSCNFLSLKEVLRQERQEHGELCDEESLEAERREIYNQRATAASWRLHTAGTVLDYALHQAGLWRESWNARLEENPQSKSQPQAGTVSVVNLIKCRSCVPDENSHDGWKDQDPTTEQIDACAPWLDIQLYILQPQILVALGGLVTAELTGLEKVKITKPEFRGTVHPGPQVTLAPGKRYELPVLPEVHPSYILRQKEDAFHEWRGNLTQTLIQARELAEQPLVQLELTPTQPPATSPAYSPAAEQLDPTQLPFAPTWPEGYAPGWIKEGHRIEQPH